MPLRSKGLVTAESLGPRPGLIEDSYTLYRLLEKEDLLKNKPPMWWPEYGNFEVIVGAVLTQNSQWIRVETSLQNLREKGLLELESFSAVETEELEVLIAPSGLFKPKAKYLKALSLSILDRFSGFENFCLEVDREWLLQQKGIGPESADSILCYACKRAVLAVDAYTSRLLNAFGYEFASYDDLQEWCQKGLHEHFNEDELSKKYALFHGMIVEYVKANSKAKIVSIKQLNI